MKITIVENGPLILKTDTPVSVRIDEDSETKSGPIALCRCGQTANKPFCDGTHREVGFEGRAGELTVQE